MKKLIGNNQIKNPVMHNCALIAVIGLLLAYAWLGSLIFEPKFEIPFEVVASVSWLEGGKIKGWTEVRPHRSLTLAQIAKTVRDLPFQMKLLPREFRPVKLIINGDSAEQYQVSESVIEISESIAVSQGQLLKAFIKSWLLQNSTNQNQFTFLRLEVVSDVLTAGLSTIEHLEIPDGRSLSLVGAKSWLSYAGTLSALCESAWKSFELRIPCQSTEKLSENLQELGFRPLFSAILWGAFRSISIVKRMNLIESWLEHLVQSDLKVASPHRPSAPSSNGNRSLAEWKIWIVAEIAALLPVKTLAERSGLSGAEADFIKDVILGLEQRAALKANAAEVVDVIFHSDLEDLGSIDHLGKESIFIVDGVKQTILFPGRWLLAKSDLAKFSSRIALIDRCVDDLKVRSLVADVANENRVVYVSSCRQTNQEILASWKVFLQKG